MKKQLMKKKHVILNYGKNSKKNLKFLNVFLLLFIFLFFIQCGSSPVNTKLPLTEEQSEIRNFICIVNRHLHPNMERYINIVIRELIDDADEQSDNMARMYEYYKRGGSGSGFVYLDSYGNNYILTNYHVIVGAYRLSVTFENERGEKTVYQNLSVVGIDEEADLAILKFPDGQKPFAYGLPILQTPVRDDTTVRAAGYPGIPEKPVWNITRGSVSNSRSFPIGMEYWYIQHNADINPGNSGGPLLVENNDNRSNIRYSVAGMNTFYISGLHGAYYAIPAERIEAFIQTSLQHTTTETLESRLAEFMEVLRKTTSNEYVYESLVSFLSSTMINANPLSIVTNTLNNNTPARLLSEITNNPVTGIAWAVALDQIEMPIYGRYNEPLAQRDTMPEVISIESNNMGGYTARLLVNGYPYRTEWVMEYGTWKLDDFIEDDGEYNDFWDLATPHPLGKKVIYSLSSYRDFDWYTLNIPRAGRLTIRTEGNTDTALFLCTDPTNQHTMERTRIGDRSFLVSDDRDNGFGTNEVITADVPAGIIYAVVTLAFGNPGEYILYAGLDGEIDNVPYTIPTNITVDPETFILSSNSQTFTNGTLRPGQTHYYRVYLENDIYYQIDWRDYDDSTGLTSPIADIMVGVRKEGSSSYLIPVTDVGNDDINSHIIHISSSQDSPRYDSNSWYIIEVRGFNANSSGNYQIKVY